jgi:MOSC domain-containing protein YiiM
MRGSVMSVNASAAKGSAKSPVSRGMLGENHGLEGDAHARPGERQVSLLAWESAERQTAALAVVGAKCPKSHSDAGLRPGDYAENLTLRGVDLTRARIGDAIVTGAGVVLEVTQIGKECHAHCAVFKRLGDCVMPREGVFARVVNGGEVSPGDEVWVAPRGDTGSV